MQSLKSKKKRKNFLLNILLISNLKTRSSHISNILDPREVLKTKTTFFKLIN
jgi:hypothetical protein